MIDEQLRHVHREQPRHGRQFGGRTEADGAMPFFAQPVQLAGLAHGAAAARLHRSGRGPRPGDQPGGPGQPLEHFGAAFVPLV